MFTDTHGEVIDLTGVQVIGPLALQVTFSDGTVRRINLQRALQTWLHKGLFLELLDAEYFSQAFYDQEGRTVAWPNGVDISPEALYSDFDPIG